MKYVICICNECSHSWLASGESPARCAKCKSSQWDGQEKKAPGRPKRETFAPDSPMAPIEEQSLADALPIKEDKLPTPEKAKKQRPMKAKKEVKSGLCPHKFIVLDDGTTACPQCK